MILHVDTVSPVPPYQQLLSQIEELIQRGDLVPGAKLPTVRQLAHDLGLAPGTVARCYRELEDGRLIVTQGRRGTFVSDKPSSESMQRRLARLGVAARVFADEARRLRIEPATAERAVRNALIAAEA